MSKRANKRYKAKGCNLYFRVQEEEHLYIADFFTEDGTFVEALTVSKDAVKYEDFLWYCDKAYGIILETGKWL